MNSIPIKVRLSSLQAVDWVSSFDISLTKSVLKSGKYKLKFIVQEPEAQKKMYEADFIINKKYITVFDYIGVHD